MICLYAMFDLKFSVPSRFLMKGFRSNLFFNNALYVDVVKVTPKLILYGTVRRLNIITHTQ